MVPRNREVRLALEGDVAGALREPAGERDLGMVLHVEEVRAAEVGVALGLAGPDRGGVDLAIERRRQPVVMVEL